MSTATISSRETQLSRNRHSGRPFLRRLIDIIPYGVQQHKLVRLSSDVKADLTTWTHFLCTYNGKTFFRSLSLSSPDLNMVADACTLGYGACFGSCWIQESFPSSWSDFHITVKEFFPVYVLISMFGLHMVNQEVNSFVII